jgi:iron(III) transport system substrate-binding protein
MTLCRAVLPLRGARIAWVLGGVLAACGLTGCSNHRTPEVVVYAAQDQVYAEPILQAFTRQTGIRVRAVYDSEAVKTVGLANRLLAEKNQPQADVFWGNEELRTRQLAALGVFRATNGVATFGYRTRRIVVNTNRLALAQAPRSLLELTN